MGILKEKLKYGKRGITLIALVITIVVLLILAEVSIAMLTGDNGILTRSKWCKDRNSIRSSKRSTSIRTDRKENRG